MKGFIFISGSTDELSLSAATSGTGSAKPMNGCRQVVPGLVSSGTISGGAAVLEGANTPDYSGTWGEVTTVSGTDMTGLSGGAEASLISLAVSYAHYRWRITSAITGGGNITARINGMLN